MASMELTPETMEKAIHKVISDRANEIIEEEVAGLRDRVLTRLRSEVGRIAIQTLGYYEMSMNRGILHIRVAVDDDAKVRMEG